MRSLLDINVVIALLDSKHDFHDQAQAWWAQCDNLKWATCPTIQNGVLRVMTNPAYNRPNKLALTVVSDLLRDLFKLADHKFWPDDLTLLDQAIFDLEQVTDFRQLTDIYLLGLATKNQGRFVSFDSRVMLHLVPIAKPENLLLF